MKRLTDVTYWEQSWWARQRFRRLRLYRDFDFETIHLLREMAGAESARVLEVGAGGSRVLPYLRHTFGYEVVGTDFSRGGCRLLQANLVLLGEAGGVVCEDLFCSSLRAETFDLAGYRRGLRREVAGGQGACLPTWDETQHDQPQRLDQSDARIGTIHGKYLGTLLPEVNMAAEPISPTPESWWARNRRLLAENPRLFFQKLATWLRPMRSDYRRRWSRGLRRWLLRYQKEVAFDKVTWMGLTARKLVLDAWVYQQILFETRPEVVIEIGNAEGGSTKFLANMLDLLGAGEVIAVDIDHSIFRGQHPRVTLVTGDSAALGTVARVAELARGRQGLVIHDGDHTRGHVLEDLRAYAPFVRPGCYFIVEDGIIDLFRAGDGLGGVNGPLGAVEQFVQEDPRFQIDEAREYFLLTYNPRGYLKRVA